MNGKPLAMYLDESARNAWKPAALAACLGLLGVYPTGSRKSRGKALAYGCLGGLVGFGAAIAWENRRLAASVVSSAWKKMSRVRDEHWLEVNPIDYA